ncbi:hypothetical protein pkur_cds_58 [Pandoravirus kuranda]|uniref:Uncharacterized protein n=1 Tax=Pandoravirus kuranda TaxID=3019033 RepID=A0AA95J416_9VIRU|nr:hypothetical protein pkur_cds_58 [Pandoravirus kuranda]
MTAFFATDNTNANEDVTVIIKAPQGTDSRSFAVPLDRFTIYRSGFLTDAVIQALRKRDADAKHDEPIHVTFTLPAGIAPCDCDHLMETLGLAPVDDGTNAAWSGLLSLNRVVKFWKALVALESRHAVDTCAANLRRIVSLDDASTVLIAYMYDALRARCGTCRPRAGDNIVATLFPLERSAKDGGASDGDVAKYMTLGNRILDAAMDIGKRVAAASVPQTSYDLFAALAMLITQHSTSVREIAVEALRDWSLALNAVDQVFGSGFSMCKPLHRADKRIEWLLGEASVGIGAFEHTIRTMCPVFADVLLGADGVIESQSVIMAGGAVVNAIQNPKTQHWLADSDIDLWIVGEDHAARAAAFERVVERLFAAAPGCRAKITGSVATFWPPSDTKGRSVPVQVIFTPYRSASQVVCNFDMTNACAYYDGDDVYATWSCAAALVTRVARSAPGMSPKIDRMLRAIDKGFFLGAAEKARLCEHNAKAKDAEAKEAHASSDAPKASGTAPTKKKDEPRADEPFVYFTPASLVKAFSFRPLSSNDYRCSDDTPKESRTVSPHMPVPVGGRFVVAMPLMDIFFGSTKCGPRYGPEQLALRLLDTKAVGPVVGAFAAAAMRDCAEARGNVVAAALDTESAEYKSGLVGCTAHAQLNGMLCTAAGFERTGSAFIRTPQSLRGRIFDGITGRPMAMDQIDAERHVFSATMSTGVSVSGVGAFAPVRIERLRVYPRSFVATAARVLASTSILAADRFVERKPSNVTTARA